MVDIALLLPIGFIALGAGFEVPQGVTELGFVADFGAVLLAIAYASLSFALGITPDKIPFIIFHKLSRTAYQPSIRNSALRKSVMTRKRTIR
jgi:hypothetical protein